MKLVLIYLITINAIAFLLMLSDKRRAIKNKWRISEAILITAATLGGGIGTLAAMYLVRHKTMHPKFTIGIPVIIILQVLTGFLCVTYL